MARSRKHRRSHSRTRHMRRTRSQRGGDLAGNPASAWGWGLGTLGNGWTQFTNSLTLQPGQSSGSVQSNDIVPVGKVNAQDSQPGVGSNLTGAVPKMNGGRRRKGKRGGNWGLILNQAAVPGALLAAQQTYRKGKRGGNLGLVLNQAAVPGVLLAAQQTYGKRSRRR